MTTRRGMDGLDDLAHEGAFVDGAHSRRECLLFHDLLTPPSPSLALEFSLIYPVDGRPDGDSVPLPRLRRLEQEIGACRRYGFVDASAITTEYFSYAMLGGHECAGEVEGRDLSQGIRSRLRLEPALPYDSANGRMALAISSERPFIDATLRLRAWATVGGKRGVSTFWCSLWYWYVVEKIVGKARKTMLTQP